MSLKTILHDFYDLTRLPLGIMAALAGLTTGTEYTIYSDHSETLDNITFVAPGTTWEVPYPIPKKRMISLQ